MAKPRTIGGYGAVVTEGCERLLARPLAEAQHVRFQAVGVAQVAHTGLALDLALARHRQRSGG